MLTTSHILSCSPPHLVCELAEQVLARYDRSAVTFISGPRCVLVQLRMIEGVAETVFNAGEILVTETRLELAGQFGFGMVIGRDPDHATALAVLDAALRMPGDPHADLRPRIAELGQALSAAYERRFAAAAATRVEFETF
ncbi:phosphonate C-P lyase system protein PhnG [Chloroflexus sp.]|uniref:phosphonate C-P lyase system protein PhnG n=1 Tax=Chloroflexus sp. TaxID=1904827 RepID=UPI00298F1163|nr:phosphonate C-P lyase system protein PhnG [Chloroflexus sp.]MDW8403013.1 phosphonate C-P lyase system protein PhnG [Chloroflexus sp.]